MEPLKIVIYIAIAIVLIAAVKTALPEAKASKPCLLGYKALCSFTPISTIILSCYCCRSVLFLRQTNLSLKHFKYYLRSEKIEEKKCRRL